ncbi:MAG: type II toxin-antitoxin system HicA family toxin [Coriobacteriaceae bacterium]|jgi:predicted RNA binding protein YcfA (HicA-like mRNA interferase family)|nr:type II toxin-antitoxin system HicA family toxin [Coriobacteriaceae bacterium]
MSERDVREVLKRFRKEQWDELPGKGSHVVFRKAGKPTISVPTSKKELKKGTYEDLARKAGWR